MARRQRQVRLTKAEQQLLRFPPTRKTWLCGRQRQVRVEGGTEKVLCGTLNSGNQSICWLCGGFKPKQPKLLWPAYERACEKAGIEVGGKWPPKLAPAEPATPRRTRRKVA